MTSGFSRHGTPSGKSISKATVSNYESFNFENWNLQMQAYDKKCRAFDSEAGRVSARTLMWEFSGPDR